MKNEIRLLRKLKERPNQLNSNRSKEISIEKPGIARFLYLQLDIQ
jgi:hypothetical protein